MVSVDIIQRFFLWCLSLVFFFMVSVVAEKVFFCMVSVVGFLFMVSVVAGKQLFLVSVAGLLVDSAAAGGSMILECIKRFLVVVFLGLVSVAGFVYGFRRGRKTFCMVSVVGLFHGFRRGKERCLWFLSLFVLWFPSWQGTFLFMVSVVVCVQGFRLLQDRGCLSDGNRELRKTHQDVSVTN